MTQNSVWRLLPWALALAAVMWALPGRDTLAATPASDRFRLAGVSNFGSGTDVLLIADAMTGKCYAVQVTYAVQVSRSVTSSTLGEVPCQKRERGIE